MENSGFSHNGSSWNGWTEIHASVLCKLIQFFTSNNTQEFYIYGQPLAHNVSSWNKGTESHDSVLCKLVQFFTSNNMHKVYIYEQKTDYSRKLKRSA